MLERDQLTKGDPVTLLSKVELVGRRSGIDLIGVADMAPALPYLHGGPSSFLASFPRAVSLGVRLVDGVVDSLADREVPERDRVVTWNYRHYVYRVVNANLDAAAWAVARCLQDEGYAAYPVPASLTVDGARLTGLASHKMAAHLAGLGWIGKDCLLITPQYGPRVRLATVFTDAPLAPGEPDAGDCGDCVACVDACPSGAITGAPFRREEPREVRLDARRCWKHSEERKKRLQVNEPGSFCGLCVYVCPHGRQAGKKGAVPRGMKDSCPP